MTSESPCKIAVCFRYSKHFTESSVSAWRLWRQKEIEWCFVSKYDIMIKKKEYLFFLSKVQLNFWMEIFAWGKCRNNYLPFADKHSEEMDDWVVSQPQKSSALSASFSQKKKKKDRGKIGETKQTKHLLLLFFWQASPPLPPTLSSWNDFCEGEALRSGERNISGGTVASFHHYGKQQKR